jgi:hypothetical protein
MRACVHIETFTMVQFPKDMKKHSYAAEVPINLNNKSFLSSEWQLQDS